MKSGKRFPSRNFILFSQKNENPFHRLGIVVKKEVGLATYRNRSQTIFEGILPASQGSHRRVFRSHHPGKKRVWGPTIQRSRRRAKKTFCKMKKENAPCLGPRGLILLIQFYQQQPLHSFWTLLSFCPFLFFLHFPIDSTFWNRERKLALHKEAQQMPSVSSGWIRSGSRNQPNSFRKEIPARETWKKKVSLR